ncbi:EamA family transporter, partial [Patescibacteria group bacterium]|nr:EamA family transporter [Patescibacteria group bacterium]
TSVLEGTIIGIAGPILSVIIGHHFYNEKVNDYVKFGLGIAVVGTLFIVLEPILFDTGIVQNTSQRILGNLLIIAYNFCFVMYIMWSKMSLGVKSLKLNKTLKFWHLKPMKRAYPATMLMILTFYVGLASFIPLAILENFGAFGPIDFAVSSLTLVPILGILYMALVSSLVAYIAFEWGLNKVEVKETAIFSYLQPVFTVPIAFLLLKELPTNPIIIGAIIIAAGVTIAELKKS